MAAASPQCHRPASIHGVAYCSQVQLSQIEDARPCCSRNIDSGARPAVRGLCYRPQEHPDLWGDIDWEDDLANLLTEFIPDHERIVLIEDTAEIQIQKPNVLRFETRREQNGLPAVTIRDLLKRRCATGPTESSWVKFEAAKPSTSCRFSTPGTAERYPPFMRTPPRKAFPGLRRAFYRAA